MDILTAIRTRRSVRRFLPEPVNDDHLEILLEAAMAAPSANNTQPWRFVVITDPATLQTLARKDPYVSMAAGAPLGILVCGETCHKFWVEGCSAAMENLLLVAHGLGYGAIWCGIHQDPEKELTMRRCCALPEGIAPFALALVGRPAHPLALVDRFDPDKIHYNVWEEKEPEERQCRPYRF